MLRLAFPALIFCLTIFPAFTEKGQYLSTFKNDKGKTDIPADEFLYQQLGEQSLPLAAFKSAIEAHRRLTEEGQIVNTGVITIIDFTKPSHMERLFVIDLAAEKILYKSLVAHGKNSGEHYATSFSNIPQSHQSSLGFYLTGKSYEGRHGYSLLLDGMEKGINDNAGKRAVVIHGASYVSHSYIDSHGRLGRSFGCPAVPQDLAKDIIDAIRERSLLFIYSDDKNYSRNSSFFNSFLSLP